MAAPSGGGSAGPGLGPVARLEVESPGGDTDLPFARLGDWPEEAVGPLGPGLFAAPVASELGGGGGQRPQPGGSAARLWEAAQPQLLRAQRQGLAVLQLLTCNMMVHFFEHLSSRNVVFLVMSASAFNTAWLSLEPSTWGWALGLLYLLTASSRVGALEPLWTAALALAAQGAFDAAPPVGRTALWYVFAGLAAASELCWWPSLEFLIEADFHSWLVHFSTYYAVIIDFWLWPQLLQLDPNRWHITKEIQRAPAETQEAIVNAGVGLAILVLLPLLACSLIAGIIIWQQHPKLCLAIGAVYVSLVTLLLLCRNVTPQQVISVGQVAIACIFVILARQQLVGVFGDTRTWKGQAALLVALLALRHAAILGFSADSADLAQVAGIVLFQLLSKHLLAAQCSAVRLGLPNPLRAVAWLPRRSGLLFGREEVHDARLVLAR